MKKLFYFGSILSALLFTACGGKKEEQSAADALHADSLSTQFNSPELKALNEEILKEPSSADLYSKRAAVYLKLKQFEEAISDSRRAIKLDSLNEKYYLTLVDVFFSNNNTRQAKELLENTEKKFPNNTETLLKLSELYFLVKQYQKAIEYANKALKIDENIARAYYIKGSIYRESGDTAKAISSLVTATEQDNTYKDAFYDLGVIYAAKKNPLAMQYYENAIRLNPSDQGYQYARAKLLQDLDKTDEAIEEYQKIVAKGSCENCLYNLGAIYLELKKDKKTALDYFTKAIAANPSYLEAYFARAYTYMQLNDKQSARADYELCLKLKPDYEDAARALDNLK